MPDIQPVLNIWTAHSREVDTTRRAIIDVSTGSHDAIGKTFSPTWQITRHRQDRAFSDEQFYNEYLNLLRRRYAQRPHDFNRAVEQGQIVLISETPPDDGAWDHRHVLVRALTQTAKQMGYVAHYNGELHPSSRLPERAQPMRLLVRGCPDAPLTLCELAASAVRRAAFRGWEVLTGDTPGIDAAVADACSRYNARYVTAGIRPTIPNYTHPYASLGTTPDQRDLLLCDLADASIFLWDGSHEPTRALHEHMLSLGKPSHLFERRRA